MFTPLKPGSTVGRHVVEGVIGSGGMGVVYAARDEHLNRRVALKVMAGHLAHDPVFRDRFAREAEVLGQLDSPHIVQVYDHGEHEGHLWIATQLVDGGDLGDWLATREPLPPEAATRLCAQVADALHDAHSRGIVHRDVKPANVLVTAPDSHRAHAVLTDFGLAREIGTPLTAVRTTTGTWAFLAPECGAGAPATPASDVYAAGCLLWTCLTGRPPYAGTEIEVALAHARSAPPTLVAGPNLSATEARRLNDVISTAMHKDPTHRYASAADLATALRATADSRAGGRRGRWYAAAGAVAAVATIGTFLVIQSQRDDPPHDGNEAADRAITGDLDDDGIGDVALLTRRDHRTVVDVSHPDGTSLTTPERWSQVPKDNVLMRGDINGDGTPELVSLMGRTTGDFTATVIPSDRSPSRRLPLKASTKAHPLYAALGDFDGDGRDDLAVTTDIYDTGQPGRVWVASSTGDGFGRFRQWYAGDRPGERAVPGDFDGDGTDDLALVGDSSIETLTSDGSRFTSTGVQPQAQRVFSLAPGDFDGDGTDELVGINELATVFVVWSLVDGRWSGQQVGQVDGEAAASVTLGVSDLNGDHLDDLVLITGDYSPKPMQLRVTLSNGDGFGPLAIWLDYEHQVNHSFALIGAAAE
ncbi:serine/threonine-protein kinase [Nocardioides jensenii]|uniref:serine/threonine-protein kinase n=1 Tax=Nocardioides jensenii TaxID=1843 RepID=UPI00082CA9F9|nr:serine/threonine-protein kinase [Nocardioides jensenii]